MKGEWPVGEVGGKRKRKGRKEKKKENERFQKYNIKIKSGNIDCFRKILKNTQS